MKKSTRVVRVALALASGAVLFQTSTCIVNDELAAVRSISPYTGLELSNLFRGTALDILASRAGEPLRGPVDIGRRPTPSALPVPGIVPMGFYPGIQNVPVDNFVEVNIRSRGTSFR